MKQASRRDERTEASGRIWLRGSRYDIAYLYEVATGLAQRFVATSDVGITAGEGHRIGGRFVAVYGSDDRRDVTLQIDSDPYPLDGSTTATVQRILGGALTTLTVARPNRPTVRLRRQTLARLLVRAAQRTPSTDSELLEDAAAMIAELATSPAARQRFLAETAYDAGPWYLIHKPKVAR